MMRAVGCHVFAGGFTMGVRRVMDVRGQLEIHALGRDTVNAMGVEFYQATSWMQWMDREDLWKDCHFCYGNPRCTGFSCVSAGHDETVHGAWSAPTKDAHEFCKFVVAAQFPIAAWESVQQAFSVGKELLDHFTNDVFVPAGYKVAHVFVNAAALGNAQHRRRYFYVVHRDDVVLNFAPPEPLPERHTTVGDVLNGNGFAQRTARPCRFRKSDEYDGDCYREFSKEECAVMPKLPPGWDLNSLARHRYDSLAQASPHLADKWDTRMSDMPFSMHAMIRLDSRRACPTMTDSCGRFVHPDFDRGCTLRELAALMGWPPGILPIGDKPFGQLAKGIVPAVGEWLARQVLDSERATRERDPTFEAKFVDRTGELVVTEVPRDANERMFDYTHYVPEKPR